MLSEYDIDGAVWFHGHKCFGLFVGIAVSEYGLELLDMARSVGEELIVIAENNSCAVDAIQYTTGATIGRGNLIIRDYGKHAYTFISREDERKIRIVLDSSAFKDISDVDTRLEKILNSEPQDIFKTTNVDVEIPSKAEVVRAMECSSCGEYAMKTRIKIIDEKDYCLPCYEKVYIGR